MTDSESKAVTYDPQEIEKRWRQKWQDTGIYEMHTAADRPKHYALTMLPYTSGDLHIGHWYAMAPSDAKARFMRMHGYNVFFPIGFDAFGLPAENAAIHRGIHPHRWTMDNIRHMREQLCSMGCMWAWDNEAISCLPGYYKWTQWFFLKFYERGLAYREKAPVDFCPQCNTTLAREQVWGEDRHCERCGTPVIRKELSQWFFRTTEYAQELLDDLEKIDWPEQVKLMQRNWIGRSEGAEVTFESEEGDPIRVFTTRPDTLWGATFMVLAPEHPLVEKLTTEAYREEVADYRQQAARQSDIERLATDKEKTGVFIGAYAINPVNEARIPIWIADYVLMSYGTGAIMAVPAHDERDFAFALKYGLPIIPVIARTDGTAKSVARKGAFESGFGDALNEAGLAYEQKKGDLYVELQGQDQITIYTKLAERFVESGAWIEIVGAAWRFVFVDQVLDLDSVTADEEILAHCQALLADGAPAPEGAAEVHTCMELLNAERWYRDVLFHAEYGEMINSSEFSGTSGEGAVDDVIEWLEENGHGHHDVNYRMHDWLVSRQRYWGAPIPMVYCDECGVVPVPYEDLPVLLPEDAEFMPTGESPLLYHERFLNTTCPKCGGPAKRETDTMDTFVCSSWYQYAYISPYYEGDVPFDPEKGDYWLPVDQYTGGIEHATMHLLYTRFFTKVMRDMGLVDFDEPMKALFCQGTILGEDNEKMSKSRGNVVNPDDYVSTLGADSVRAYLMFMGPWNLGGSWSSSGIEGVNRFLHRLWSVIVQPVEEPSEGTPSEDDIASLRRITHQTIRDVTQDYWDFEFNTALASMMKLNNYLMKAKRTDVYGTEAWQEAVETIVLLLAPIAPHLGEELWERIGGEYSVFDQSWPTYEEELAAEETITLVAQINGTVRGRVEMPADLTEEQAKEAALTHENIQRHLEEREVVRMIYVPGRLVNIVAK